GPTLPPFQAAPSPSRTATITAAKFPLELTRRLSQRRVSQLSRAVVLITPMRPVTPLACALPLFGSLVGGISALAASPPDLSTRPQPPSHRAVERATGSFVAAQPSAGANAKAPASAPTQAKAPSRIFPNRRLVALYGAPQLQKTVIGLKSVA